MTAKAAYPLKMPVSLKQAAERLATEDGVSLNQWINVAVAQKVGSTETIMKLRARYGEPRPNDLQAILARAPDVAPEPGDELPEDLRHHFRPG